MYKVKASLILTGVLLPLRRHFVLASSKCHVIKISKIFGDFVPRDTSLAQGLLPSIRHFENRRGEGPGDEVAQRSWVRILGLCSSSVTAALALMTVITQLLLYGQT